MAHRKVVAASQKIALSGFDFSPADDSYLYAAFYACGAPYPNSNKDAFTVEELTDCYDTFIGKPVYINHANDDLTRARGVIIDAICHFDEEEDSCWVEILIELDKETFPYLAQLIENGDIDTVSMGCNLDYTECSVCGNIAYTDADFCEHIQNKMQNDAYEICHGVEFFEISLVYDPADPNAVITAVHQSSDKTADFALPEVADDRVASCPVCGSGQFDGKTCPVCGYIKRDE